MVVVDASNLAGQTRRNGLESLSASKIGTSKCHTCIVDYRHCSNNPRPNYSGRVHLLGERAITALAYVGAFSRAVNL